MRHVLIDKQGNFGSIAGLPAAAMRYTEARMSAIAALMMDDIKLDTVDFLPTYDERHGPSRRCLPSKFPNLLVNGATASPWAWPRRFPPHNLGEICDAIDPGHRRSERFDRRTVGNRAPVPISRPAASSAAVPASAGAIIPAEARSSSAPGRLSKSTASATGSSSAKFPSSNPRDRIEERIAALVNEGKIPGISGIRNESDLKEPVRLVCELKRDADPDIVLNQLYQFSPLQDSFSLIFLALVDGKPRMLSFKELLQEFIRHRETVIRRRTQFLLSRARQRKHTVEGLAAGTCQHRRSDPRHPKLVDPGRGKRAADADSRRPRRCFAGRWATRDSRFSSRNAARAISTRLRPCRPTPSCE